MVLSYLVKEIFDKEIRGTNIKQMDGYSTTIKTELGGHLAFNACKIDSSSWHFFIAVT